MSRIYRGLLCLVCLGLCLGLTSVASAQVSRFYIASYLGLNTYDSKSFSNRDTGVHGSVDYKNAISFAGALGFRLNRYIRFEAETSYRNAGVNDVRFGGLSEQAGGHDKTSLYMANVFYDLPVNWKRVTPFITAGVGLADHSVKFEDPSGTLPQAGGHSLGFAWQAGAGLQYRVSPVLAFTGDYKYLNTSDVKADGYTLGYSSHELRLGLQYDLPIDFLK